ncbi:MAG: ABC transporter transmembrane domain-containing protein, partial [Candidatus Latescibacteria bacterium]|nr:ABC transporter transmembrane domain-containing protein [Candidatus Latescibacterota bacterium]
MDVFLRLTTYIRPHLTRVSIGIAATLVIIGFEAVPPLIMRKVIDDILTPYFSEGHYAGNNFTDMRIASDLDLLLWFALALLGVFILRTFFSFLNRYLLNRAGQEILFDLRVQVYDHLQHLGLRFYNDRSTGELMSRVTADVESLQNTITDTLERILVNVSTILIFGSILVSLNWELALITLAPMPIYSVLIILYNRKVRPFYTMARERIADISALLQDNLSGIRVIKCFARENHELSRFTQRCKAFLDINITLIKIRVAFFPAARLVISLGPLLIL